MKVPQIWTRVPYGAEPLRKEVLPQRNVPGRGCCEENEFGTPGLGGPVRRDQQDLLLVLRDLAQCLCEQAHWGKRILARDVIFPYKYRFPYFPTSEVRPM